ncbi:fimbria/pilus periplasmic chaperone (plasmid) [Enterobacter kobei]|nr:fimbria/pilus periplasmic chaperone [Enterobacter kobei]MBO4154598.1 fimbria/pilus periplasmic chaperone [Enterobacter kobei]UOY68663.1 fimbria/pilus periplasmic chaperone [Enterobacter kobei]
MKFSFRSYGLAATLSSLILYSTGVMASAVINGTRVIYPSDSKEVSVKISNNGPSPVLLQSWIDNGDQDARPSSIKVPFVLTPPMNRVDAGKGQTLRISYAGGALPMDKESVFWLNVLEVPAKKKASAEDNTLQVAFRSRIKIFYRPVGLEGNANDAPKSVTWQSKGNSVEANNPTPYYVNLVNLSVNGKSVAGAMIPPRSTLTVALPAHSGNKITGGYVNDYGAINNFESAIK